MNRHKREEAMRELVEVSADLEMLAPNPELTPDQVDRLNEARRTIEEVLREVTNRKAAA
jgi:hypothetical protein